MTTKIQISVEDLEIAYGDRVILYDINFEIYQGEIFMILGGSGAGKSSLLRTLIGLENPKKGKILFNGIPRDEWLSSPEYIARRIGVLFQNGALWTSMNVFENVALPLQLYTKLSLEQIIDIVRLKLALVGLEGIEFYMPSQLSGGMQKRVALARAMVLDPNVLFLDEPSAGLDPITARKLDQLIKQLRDTLGTTFVIVTHEIESVLQIADRVMFIDGKRKTMIGIGKPCDLLKQSPDEIIKQFFFQAGISNQTIPKVCE